MIYVLIIRYRTESGRWRVGSKRLITTRDQLESQVWVETVPDQRVEVRTFDNYDVAKLLAAQ